MKLLAFLSVILLFSQVKPGPITTGEMSAITCISSQNLHNYAEKIAVFMVQDKAPTDDKKFNKFIACHWKNKGLLTEDGSIDTENLRIYLEKVFSNGAVITKVHREIARNTVERCNIVGGKNPGQNAVLVQNCITAYLTDYDKF